MKRLLETRGRSITDTDIGLIRSLTDKYSNRSRTFISVKLPPPEEVACLLVLEGTLLLVYLKRYICFFSISFSPFFLVFDVFFNLLLVQSNCTHAITSAPQMATPISFTK